MSERPAPLELPFPELTAETLQAISERHGLNTHSVSKMPAVGIINGIYALGDTYVLRVPKNHPACTAAARREAVAVPIARRVGVATPELVVFDDSNAILDVPYTIYERIYGETLGLLDLDPHASSNAYRSLGRELALLHEGVTRTAATTSLVPPPFPDPRLWPDELAAEGYLSGVEARWLMGWLEHLAPATLAQHTPSFIHADTQASNVMVEAGSLDYLALLDWGGAGWSDPAYDFAHMPLRAVPLVLKGYREGAQRDETFEARILWFHLMHALGNLRRPPQPGRAWAERPLSFLLEIVRFLLETTEPCWHNLQPTAKPSALLQDKV